MDEFFVRCNCKNRRFTGGKSRFLQEADGRKGIASAADELCGSAIAFIYKAVHNSCQFSPRQLFRFNSIMCGLPSVTNEESIVQCAIE